MASINEAIANAVDETIMYCVAMILRTLSSKAPDEFEINVDGFRR
jgi:hypothetical protein